MEGPQQRLRPKDEEREAEGTYRATGQAQFLTRVLVRRLQKPLVQSRLPLERAPEVKETGKEMMLLV